MWLRIGSFIAAAIVLTVLLGAVVLWSALGADVWHAYPSPERHENVSVQRFEFGALPPADAAGRITADFDGDGIADRVETEYFHMEPLFSRSTSGLLHVISGADGSRLATHAIDTPENTAYWCADRDHNGTNELVVEDDHALFVLSRTTRGVR